MEIIKKAALEFTKRKDSKTVCKSDMEAFEAGAEWMRNQILMNIRKASSEPQK